MEFYINGNKTDVQLENEKTVGDILQSFAQECENNKAAVIGIKVNDLVISAEAFDEEAKKELTPDIKFEFEVVTETAVAENFIVLANHFKNLSEDIENVPNLFINGKGNEANALISKLADAIDQFCHTAALASLFPETFNTTKIGDMNITEFFEDFSPILTDFENALQTNDTVLVGDLCEYEICPRLQKLAGSLETFGK